MTDKPEKRTKIPAWIRLAVWSIMIQGTGIRKLRAMHITAQEAGLPVSFRTGCGRDRQSLKDERFLIGDLVNEDTCRKWQKSEAFRAERAAYYAAFSDSLQAKGAIAAEAALDLAPLMIKGVRPKRDKYGQQVTEGGKPVYEPVAAAVSAQMAGVALQAHARMQAAAAPPAEAPPAADQSYAAQVAALRQRLA